MRPPHPTSPSKARTRSRRAPPAAVSPAARTDSLIREVAARQDGVVARAQLVRAGASGHVLDRRLRTGRLVPLHRGVYRVGPVEGPRQREWAALLSCSGPAGIDDAVFPVGADAVRSDVALSHRTAAGLWGLLPPPPPDRPVEVSGPRSLRARAAVRVHRVERLDADEVTRVGALPVTAATRTLVDLASRADIGDLERAVARGLRDGIVTEGTLGTTLVRHRGRRGARVLRRLLDGVGEPELTRSGAEARLLELVREGGLPRPRLNARVEGLEVDFLWRGPRLVVEVDGFAYHGNRAAFERDRDRDATLAAAGYRVVRITWRQLDRRPIEVLVRVAQALAQVR